MQFEHPQKFEIIPIIKVLGVGGGGSNAVDYMFKKGIKGVEFAVCNTDVQALEKTQIPKKLSIGANLTGGYGAGSNPEVARLAAEDAAEDIKAYLQQDTKMLFIAAGMGGGTGTGASPVIARIARELGILTVGIITTPFKMEGKPKMERAMLGIAELRKHVDSIMLIDNENLRSIYRDNKAKSAFEVANDVLCVSAKGISEMITVPGEINVDFEDVKTVLKNSGVTLMGNVTVGGENRTENAVRAILDAPLIRNSNIEGATHILLSITYSNSEDGPSINDLATISERIQEETGGVAEMIFGTCIDDSLGDQINLTLVVTGFDGNEPYLNSTPNEATIQGPQVNEVALKEEQIQTVINVQGQVDPSPIADLSNHLIVKSAVENQNKVEEVKESATFSTNISNIEQSNGISANSRIPQPSYIPSVRRVSFQMPNVQPAQEIVKPLEQLNELPKESSIGNEQEYPFFSPIPNQTFAEKVEKEKLEAERLERAYLEQKIALDGLFAQMKENDKNTELHNSVEAQKSEIPQRLRHIPRPEEIKEHLKETNSNPINHSTIIVVEEESNAKIDESYNPRFVNEEKKQEEVNHYENTISNDGNGQNDFAGIENYVFDPNRVQQRLKSIDTNAGMVNNEQEPSFKRLKIELTDYEGKEDQNVSLLVIGESKDGQIEITNTRTTATDQGID